MARPNFGMRPGFPRAMPPAAPAFRSARRSPTCAPWFSIPTSSPSPVNVAGELFIGGAGLARGYLGRPGLTAERFVPDPYGDGERLYRTGDIVRRRSDGVLEFVGRRDHQVKLRGHRIELSEIELALQDCPGVLRAVVQLRDDLPSGEPGLVAYLIASSPAPTESTLIKHLEAKLPSYLRPAHFVFIRELPLTPSGKVDRSGLPLPQTQTGIA